MPSRDWRPTGSTVALWLIALAVWSALVWGVAQQQAYRAHYSDYATGQNAEDARKEITNVCATETASGAYVECVERVLGTERDNRRADNDLKAQENMALWAALMVGTTVVQIVIGSIGLFLLIGSFQQGRIQAHASQRAVGKATVANVVARETGQAQVRAYLSAHDFQICEFNDPVLGEIVVFKFQYANSGNSPARAVRIAWRFGFSEGLATPSEFIEPMYTFRGDLRASGSDEFSSRLEGIDLDRFTRPEPAGFHVQVYLWYRDAFGFRQRDDFHVWIETGAVDYHIANLVDDSWFSLQTVPDGKADDEWYRKH